MEEVLVWRWRKCLQEAGWSACRKPEQVLASEVLASEHGN